MSIGNAVVDAVGICQVTGDDVRFVFNDIPLLVTGDDTTDSLLDRYAQEYARRSAHRWGAPLVDDEEVEF